MQLGCTRNFEPFGLFEALSTCSNRSTWFLISGLPVNDATISGNT